MRLILCLIFTQIFLFRLSLSAQPGCTDPQAANFNAGATMNDGSCIYQPTNLTPHIKTPVSTLLNETSGLVMAGGALWTHNDSEGAPKIYQIDTLSGQILRTVTLGGITSVDWEDMAFDGTYLYVGDFGNNANGNRDDLIIYKFPLSAVPAGDNAFVPASAVEWIQFSYEDQVDFMPQGANNTPFDCEAMIVQGGQIHLFTKNWRDNSTAHYTLPTAEGIYEAKKTETFFSDGLVTGADVSATGVIVLCGYRLNSGQCFMWLLFDYAGDAFFSGNKRRIELGTVLASGQVEGICLRENGYGYLSNERTLNLIPARLYSFSIGQWLPASLLPASDPVKKNETICDNLYKSLNFNDLQVFGEQLPPDARCTVWDAQGRTIWQGKAGEAFPRQLSPGAYYVQVSVPKPGQNCAFRFLRH